MISNNQTFSADVKLHLYTGDTRYELGQLGPDFAILRTAQDISENKGELETIIDGKSTRWKIRITSPITVNSRRFSFEAA